MLLSGGCARPLAEIAAPTDLDQQLETLGVEPYISPTPAPPVPTPQTEINPTLPPPCPAPYLEAENQRPAYNLSAYLGIKQHAAYVEEVIVYPNLTGEQLDEIWLVVDPNWQQGVFSLSALSLTGMQIDSFTLSEGKLSLPLDTPLPEGCTLELSLSYHLDIPEQAGVFGYTEDQLVLTNWFPFIPPFRSGSGWVVHPPGEYGEHLVYQSADFYVSLEIADPPENVLIAAPAPAKEQGGQYQYQLDGARTFSMAVLTDYSLAKKKFHGIEISVYSRRATIREVEAALGAAEAALQVFEGLYGPYSLESLTITQLEMYDGMEYDGIFFLGEDVFKTYNWSSGNMLVFLVVHETAHNWWFSQVGSDQAVEPWLDEALATYSEVLFYELAYPELVDWWWKFRVAEYDPAGMVDASIYDYGLYEDYRRAVYLRGVEFIQSLREQLGDEAFFTFLRRYLEQGRYQVMTADDFFGLLEDEFGSEVFDLQGEYFGSR